MVAATIKVKWITVASSRETAAAGQWPQHSGSRRECEMKGAMIHDN
jgi:hypothetical protein